jgi:hypothetical protein
LFGKNDARNKGRKRDEEPRFITHGKALAQNFSAFIRWKQRLFQKSNNELIYISNLKKKSFKIHSA